MWYTAIVIYDTDATTEVEVVCIEASSPGAVESVLLGSYPAGVMITVLAGFETREEAMLSAQMIPLNPWEPK